MKKSKIEIEAFSFGGGEDAALNPPLTTAETKATDCEQLAQLDESLGFPESAKVHRENANTWRTLLADDADYWRCCENLMDGVDFLLVGAQASNTAAIYLRIVIEKGLRGLHALAANGREPAATLLIDCLVNAVRDFEFLASHRPQLFTHYTRRLALIPATISPQYGNAEECKELMRKLEVGMKSIFSINTKRGGKRWSETTPANKLALRLVRYIDMNRSNSKLYASCLEIIDDCPAWFPALANLKDLSKATSIKWAQVAWQILLEVTDDKPQEHPNLLPLGKSAASKKPKYCKTLHPATRAANVKAKIRSRLFEAFETIAGGSNSSPDI